MAKCLSCGSEGTLLAKVTIVKMVPLADRGGTIKIGGQKLGQADLKETWDTVHRPSGIEDRLIRGPIICADCEAEHFYVVGSKRPIRLGSFEEAVEAGHDKLVGE